MTAPDPTGNTASTATSTVVLQADVNPYTQQMQQAERQTNAVAGAVDALATRLANLSKNAGHKLINLGRDDVLSLGAAATSAAVFEKQLSTLRATSAVTGQSMKGLEGSVTSTFQKFPVSRGQVVALDEALTSLGVKGVSNINSLSQTFIKLGAATGESTTGLASGLTQLSRQMGNMGSQQIGNFANSLLTVSKTSGVSASSVLDFSQAIAPMARQAGIGEAAVLGISAAFSKAGADGYVAANTFNSIVNDITTLTRTGSPELAKYASFIGVTVNQFKKLPAKQQITDIFDSISKGGPKALNFVNELGLGTRSLTAVQALAQSGGLTKAINQATGASHNQDNLNKGSRAAFNDLTDDLARVRNQFTQLADLIAGPLLKPLGWLARGFADFLQVITSIVRALGPLPTLVGALVAPLSLLAGGALVHAGAIGTLALGRTILSPNSGPRTAFRQGRQAGAALAGGASQESVAEMNPASAMYYGPGRMPVRARAGYGLGQYVGRRAGAPGPEGEQATVPVGGFRAGFNRARYGAAIPQATVLTGEEAAAASAQALNVSAARVGAANVARGAVRLPTMFFGAQARGLKDSYTPGLERSLYQGGASKGPVANLASFNEETKARLAEAGVIKAVIPDVEALGKAMLQAAAETVKAGGSMAAAGASRVVGVGRSAALGQAATAEAGAGTAAEAGLLARSGSALGRGAGMAAGGLARAGSAVGGAMFSPLGMMATMIAIPLLSQGLSALKKPPMKITDDEGTFLNPVKALNDQLGITTTKVASFGDALSGATGSATNTLAPKNQMDMTQALNVTPGEVSKYANRGNTKDKTLNALTGDYSYDQVTGTSYSGYQQHTTSRHVSNSINTPQNAAALLSTYDLTDPRTVAQAKDNLLSLGYSRTQVESILKQATVGNPNYATLGQAATRADVAVGQNASTNNGPPPRDSSKASKQLIDAALTSIGNRDTTNLQSHSAKFATATELQQVSSLLSPALGQASGRRSSAATNPQVAQIARTLATITGGKASDFYTESAGVYSLRTSQTGVGGITELLSHSKAGKTLLSSAGITGGSVGIGQLQSIISGSATQASSSVPTPLTTSRLGRAVGGSRVFQAAAFGSESGNPAAQQQAIEQAAGDAMKVSKSSSAASAGLMKLADATGGAAGTLLTSAAQWARTLQGFKLPYQSRETQVTAARQNMAADYGAAHATGASQASVDQYKQDRSTYEQSKQSYDQYLQSLYQTAQSYGRQMERSKADENEQIFRSQRDFQIQSLQSQEDYQRQTQRSQQDFSIQMKRAAQQSSETIYNPFTRVQAAYTSDAGTISQNLKDQNQRIKKQYKELGELKKMGISQETIDTLQLADPANAQQTEEFYTSLKQNKQLIGQINSQTESRVKDTKALTQSSFSESYRNTVSDFTRGLDRAAQDYQTAHDRAVDAQHRALNDMAIDYNKMVNRSAADLKTSMTEIYGSFGNLFGRTLDKVTTDIGKYAPKAAATIQKQLDQLKTSNPEIFDPNYAGAPAPGKPAPAAGSGSPDHLGTSAGRSPYAHAAGGISNFEHRALISESNKPEAIIPLDSRGMNYMSGMYYAIARSVVQQMNVGGHPMMPSGPSSVHQDYSTNFTGDITVEGVTDSKKLIAELQARQRLAKLSSPAKSHA